MIAKNTTVKILEHRHQCYGRIGMTRNAITDDHGTPVFPVITRDDQGRRCTSFHYERDLLVVI